MAGNRGELARTTLGVLFIGGLAAASFWVLRPFLGAFVWAVMVVVATWPALRGVERWFGGRRVPAVLVMTLVILLVFVLPITLAVGVISKYADGAATWFSQFAGQPLPPPPDWVAQLPLVGSRLAEAWGNFAGRDIPELATELQPYARDLTQWIVTEAGAIGMVLAQFLLIVILAAVLYAGGEDWGAWMIAFGRRLADDRGANAVRLAGQAIRGVALGVVVTAILQSALGGLGLAIAGVPLAGVLTAVMFALCIAQIGPLLVMLGGVAWLFYTGSSGWGAFLLVWSIIVGLMDNFVRPVLIKRGADLPLLLIFAGVIGGLLSFGLVGIFVGPVVLAVTYTLVDAWVKDKPLESA
jgi:predicted PurR-regulated permease PerM